MERCSMSWRSTSSGPQAVLGQIAVHALERAAGTERESDALSERPERIGERTRARVPDLAEAVPDRLRVRADVLRVDGRHAVEHHREIAGSGEDVDERGEGILGGGLAVALVLVVQRNRARPEGVAVRGDAAIRAAAR